MPNHITNRIFIDADSQRLIEILDAVKSDELGRGSIDFNKLIPMPESLNIESGNCTDTAMELFLTFLNPAVDYFGAEQMQPQNFAGLVTELNARRYSGTYDAQMSQEKLQNTVESYGGKFEPQDETLQDLLSTGKQAVTNFLTYGAKDWYDWCVNNWGTKWNAYSFDDIPPSSDNEITFHTAWAGVPQILEKLSKRFPYVTFEYAYADEDIGSNVGRLTYKGGEVIEQDIPNSQSKEAYEMAFDIHASNAEDYGLKWDEKSQNYEYDDHAFDTPSM